MNKVSIVIPVYINNSNTMKFTIDCLRDVLKTCNADIEVVVVDDGSKKPVSRILTKLFPNITVLENSENQGFAKTVNKGIAAAKHDYVCLLNNDIKLPNPNWLKLMLGSLDSFDLTAPAGGKMDSQWNYIPGEAKKSDEDFTYLVGWCLLIKRKVFDKIGLMPTDFARGFFEDVLFCLRAKKAGFKLGITENTNVQHLYHATFKSEGFNLAQEYKDKREVFLKIANKENLK